MNAQHPFDEKLEIAKIKYDNMNQMIGFKEILVSHFEAICRFTKVDRMFLTWKRKQCEYES